MKPSNKHLVLVGLMGSGKSTIARLLRRTLHLPVYEIDSLIEKAAGKSIPEIFTQDGEALFRGIERETVQSLVELPFGIVSTGGGTFVSEQNREILLQCGWVFYLRGSPQELSKRIQSTASRPLLQGREKEDVLQELFLARDPAYRQAHITIETDHRSSQAVADEVSRMYTEKMN